MYKCNNKRGLLCDNFSSFSVCFSFYRSLYTRWPIKTSRSLALNYKKFKLKSIKLDTYFSKQIFFDRHTEIQVDISHVHKILSKIVLRFKMQKNDNVLLRLKSGDFVFMQDSAPCSAHRAKVTQDDLQSVVPDFAV